jgi:hypothetical protein
MIVAVLGMNNAYMCPVGFMQTKKVQVKKSGLYKVKIISGNQVQNRSGTSGWRSACSSVANSADGQTCTQ